MFEHNFQFVLLLASLIGFSVSYMTVFDCFERYFGVWQPIAKEDFCLEWNDKIDFNA